MMYDLIPIISVNHTGSHSVGERFREQLPDYNYIQGNKLKRYNMDFPLIDRNRGNIIRGIIHPKIIMFVIELSEEYRLVIPMRDPLLSLISDSDWYANGAHILLGFFIWATKLFDLKPFHISVDLDISKLTYKSVNFKDLPFAHKTKDAFSNLKSTGLRKAYCSKDVKFLFDNLLDFKMLCTIEPILRPPLEKLGYRNLLWWDTPYAVKNITSFDKRKYDEWLKHYLFPYFREELNE